MKASERQVGGDHYVTMGMQPLEHTYLNYGIEGLRAAVHTKVDKYLLRRKDDDALDVAKAIHCMEFLLEKLKLEGVPEVKPPMVTMTPRPVSASMEIHPRHE